MSWPRNSWYSGLLLLVMLLVVGSGCGFTPLHGQHMAAPQLKLIEIAPITGREGQLLRNRLEDLLARGGGDGSTPPAYRLQASITITPQAAAIETDREITRYNLHLLSNFRLIRLSDGAEIYSGKLRRISSYNVSDSDFSTFVSRRDALRRGIEELAADYHLRLAAFFASPSSGYDMERKQR